MMEFLSGLASMWAVVWTILFLLVLSGLIEYEQGWLSLLLTAGVFAVAEVYWDAGLVDWGTDNPGRLLMYAVLYVVIGVAWSLIKWSMYVSRRRTVTTEAYSREKKNYGSNAAESLEAFAVSSSNPLHPSRHKSRILMWMAWWVPSVLSTILFDFLDRFWDLVYDRFSNVFVRIGASIVSRGGE